MLKVLFVSMIISSCQSTNPIICDTVKINHDISESVESGNVATVAYRLAQANKLYNMFYNDKRDAFKDEIDQIMVEIEKHIHSDDKIKCMYFILFQLYAEASYFKAKKYQKVALKCRDELRESGGELGKFCNALYYLNTPKYFGGDSDRAMKIFKELKNEFDKPVYAFYLSKAYTKMRENEKAKTVLIGLELTFRGLSFLNFSISAG